MKKVFTENEIPAIAELVIQYIVKHKNKDGATIVALSGDLGAGKTTVTKEIANLLGIKDKVISPTFVLLKSYKLSKKDWKQFHHIDAYRLEAPKEISKLGWEKLTGDAGNVIFLEWPEQIEGLLPKKHISISLKHKSETKREITLK
jgi:tRNA threonylcarbamoyladenosine biosynthesis protein TsaE